MQQCFVSNIFVSNVKAIRYFSKLIKVIHSVLNYNYDNRFPYHLYGTVVGMFLMVSFV